MATHTTTTAAGTITARTAVTARQRTRSAARDARNLFGQHDVPAALSSPLLGQICRGWVTINQSRDARERVASWGTEHSSLAGCSSPGDVVDLIADTDRTTVDTVLRSLLQLSQRSDAVAGAILIQTMLPVLSKMPHTLRPANEDDGYEETLQRVLAAFWEVIVEPRELPRPCVAGRLRLDTLHRVTAHRRSPDAWWEDQVLFVDGYDGYEDLRDTADFTDQTAEAAHVDLDPEQSDLLDVLRWMCDSGRFSADDARFLGEVFLVDGGDQKAAAHRLGLSHAATRQRVSRLRTRLCTAVANEVEPALALAS